MTTPAVDEDLPGGLAYFEWCAAPDASPDDLGAIAAANPALGTRLNLGFILGVEREDLTDEEFLVERLGLWDTDPDVVEPVIPPERWAHTLVTRGKPQGPIALAFDASPDLRSCAISVSDGTYLEVIEHRMGADWVPARLAEPVTRHTPLGVAGDPRGPASGLLQDVVDAGVTLHQVTAAEYTQACGSFLAAVLATTPRRRQLRRRHQPVLDAAVAGATRRKVVDAWAWDRRSADVDLTPLVAATLARWAAGAIEPPKRPSVGGDVDEDAYAVALTQIEQEDARALQALEGS